ncbi:hypothetical protein FGO68_gene7843 [Halteria grandinella]|uniref:Uncharacterized protein n=1 Tax=Halteria grandinella TaxID=5974 RepID=A0A8J8SVP4_HALGN|nr:hypothetical protein FGO68_gene7843 [Halteria grandinella]
MIKPYKDPVVNAFSVINESVLLIIGFYLFIFLDSENQRPSNLRFYSWLIIGLVVLMVACNMLFILGLKVMETYHTWCEYLRVKRLREVSEIEQKYLFFDYRKFFLTSLTQQVKYHQEEILKGESTIYKKVVELKQTKVETEESEEEEGPPQEFPVQEAVQEPIMFDDRDQIPPDAYTNENPQQNRQSRDVIDPYAHVEEEKTPHSIQFNVLGTPKGSIQPYNPIENNFQPLQLLRDSNAYSESDQTPSRLLGKKSVKFLDTNNPGAYDLGGNTVGPLTFNRTDGFNNSDQQQQIGGPRRKSARQNFMLDDGGNEGVFQEDQRRTPTQNYKPLW